MGKSEVSEVCAGHRLKREECTRTKHDSEFSKWQILVGPSDWEDYSLGKEGAARYRIHNLPKNSGPGLYELGIAVSHTGLGREVGKLDPHRIVAVYLGQADDVRARLQRYGRSGAHLANVQLQNGPGLFEEVFSKRYSVVFRWAPMENKRDAEKTEAQLLDRFDYALNRGSNGLRRPYDILQKLDNLDSNTTWIPRIVRKLQTFNQKQVGIRIEARKPLLLQNESNTSTDEGSNNFLSQVFIFSRSRPRSILEKSKVGDKVFLPICGVTLDDGTACRRPPVPGRKRCEEHKAWRICGPISNLVRDKKSSYVRDEVLDSSSRNDQDYDTCGVILHDGTPCRRPPVPGRKRCEEHKWRRIYGSLSNSVTDKKSSYVHDAVLDSSFHNNQDCGSCGVDLGNGIYCRKQPVAGRKRCEEHKWLRANSLVTESATKDKSHVSGFSTSNDWKYNSNPSQLIKYDRSQPQLHSYRSSVYDFSIMCGAINLDGSLCRRRPSQGRKQCWQHKHKWGF